MERFPINIKENIWSENYFDKADIVALGEEHHGTHDDAIIKFLDKFLPELDGVFYEMAVNYQEDIDLYMSTGEISKKLEWYFKGAEIEGNSIRGVLHIFDRLKEHNIKVICFDSSKTPTDEYKNKSQHGHYYLKGKSRDEDMFSNIMDFYQKHPGKYVVIGGSAHFDKGKHFRSGEDTLGERLTKRLSDKSKTIILNF